MRWSLVLAWVVMVVLSASVAGVTAVSVHTQSPVAPQSGVHTLATDTIIPTDSAGTLTENFQPGLSSGNVYFTATDPTDTTAVVQVNDQNSSRDGLTNPVASWTVKFVGGVNESWVSGAHYAIPLSLLLGGTWNITISGTTAGFASTIFEVQTYSVGAEPSVSVTLPGQPSSVFYDLIWYANGAADSKVSTLTVLATYFDATSATRVSLPGFPMTLTNPAPLSSVPFTTPASASTGLLGGMDFEFYANTSAGTYPNSEFVAVGVGVGVLQLSPVTLAACPGCGVTTFLPSGSPAYVSFSGTVMGQFLTSAPAAGAEAKIVFLANGVAVPATQVPGSPPATISLNSQGQGSVLFWADIPPFSGNRSNTVNVTLVDPWLATANQSSHYVNFTTSHVPGLPGFTVMFQYSHYYSGAQATAEWQLGNYSSVGSSAGWTIGEWLAYNLNSDSLFAAGNIDSSAATGSFTVSIPTSMTGTLGLILAAHNATGTIATVAETNVTGVVLLLSPSEATYLPGDTVGISVTVQGVNLAGLTLSESVTDLAGNLLSSGPVAINGSFNVSIPTIATPTEIDAVVTAQNASAGVVASQSLGLLEASTFDWSTSIATASNYIDNSYQPGQTIQISYSLTAVGKAQLPTEFEVVIAGVTSANIPAHIILVQTSAATGQVAMTIPSNAPNGVQLIEVAAATGPGPSSVYVSWISLNIEKDPPPLNYEVGTGSGFTLGWLLLLIVIVLVAVILVLMIRNRALKSASPKPPVQPYSPPPGPQPTGPGEGSWQETPNAGPAGTSVDQPPLPPPSS